MFCCGLFFILGCVSQLFFVLLLPNHYVCKLHWIVAVRSQPADQSTSQMGWAALCFFCFSWFQKSLLNFTNRYTRYDLMLVFNFWICFVMVFYVFVLFCSQINTYVSLNAFVLSGASQPTSRPARGDELAGSFCCLNRWLSVWGFCFFHFIISNTTWVLTATFSVYIYIYRYIYIYIYVYMCILMHI